MALIPGDHIAHYEILGVMGRGGMGEVYRARDAKLDREVAIKVLSPQFSRDPDRLARFEREAKVLAALSHPNIATIYGREDLAIVMELVEGDTLADRLKSGALPLDETIAIAQQIIAALEAAHDKGVVHRDLKPANVKAPHDAPTKVLDFGLATAIQTGSRDPAERGADSPTLTMGATAAGTIMGTAAYMSPEQAAGKPVDKRADIWSFGVVLWEMLTGQRLFTGESVSHILADVLRAPIEFEKIPAGPLRQLLQRCLDRDLKTRLRDIGEARIALTRASQPEPAPPLPAPVEAKKPFLWIAATAGMAALAAVGLWGWLKPVPAEPRPITHFVTSTPQGIAANPIAVSPDGTRIAWTSTSFDHIYLRTMDNPAAKPIPGTEGGRFPVFSPDGQWLAFSTGTGPYQVKKVPLAGGAALTLATAPVNSPMSWGADGNLLLPGPSIIRIPESGGQISTVGKIDPAKGELIFVSPQLLPGGTHILAGLATAKGGVNDVPALALDAKTGERKVLLENAGETRFLPSGSRPDIGHLVYARNGSIFAAPFDAGSLKLGSAIPVLEGMRNLGGLMGAGFSRTGTLAYPVGSGSATLGNPATLTWVDRQGTEQPASATVRSYASPRVSPDGTRLAFEILELGQTIGRHLWLLDLVRGTTSRLTFERTNGIPVWTPDGRQLIYTSMPGLTDTRGVLASLATDGSGQPATLMDEGPFPTPTSISPDGKFVMGTRGNDVWVLPLGGDPKTAKPQPFLDNRFTRAGFQFSPDGKWVAYQSNESGRNEVYVSPFPGPGGKSQVSTDGGTQPRWNRNGRELFFRSGATMMVADTELAPAFRAGTPKMLFEKVSTDYDVHPDGKRFLMLKPAATTADNSELHIILNWFEDLRKKVPLQ